MGIAITIDFWREFRLTRIRIRNGYKERNWINFFDFFFKIKNSCLETGFRIKAWRVNSIIESCPYE